MLQRSRLQAVGSLHGTETPPRAHHPLTTSPAFFTMCRDELRSGRTALTALRRSDTAATLRSLASSYVDGSLKGLGASEPPPLLPMPLPAGLSPRPTKLPRSVDTLQQHRHVSLQSSQSATQQNLFQQRRELQSVGHPKKRSHAGPKY